MRTTFVAIVVAAVVGCAKAPPAEPSAIGPIIAGSTVTPAVRAGSAVMFAGPSSSSQSIGSLEIGRTAVVERLHGGWALIDAGTLKGWADPRVLITVAAAGNVPVAGASAKGMADGFVAGTMAAEHRSTGGALTSGIVGGVVLGLIGTAVAYYTQGADSPRIEEMMSAQQSGTDYLIGYQQGYADKSKAKKRSAALGGGLVGTLVSVLAILAYYDSY